MRRPSTQETLGVSCGRSSGKRPLRAFSTGSWGAAPQNAARRCETDRAVQDCRLRGGLCNRQKRSPCPAIFETACGLESGAWFGTPRAVGLRRGGHRGVRPVPHSQRIAKVGPPTCVRACGCLAPEPPALRQDAPVGSWAPPFFARPPRRQDRSAARRYDPPRSWFAIGLRLLPPSGAVP